MKNDAFEMVRYQVDGRFCRADTPGARVLRYRVPKRGPAKTAAAGKAQLLDHLARQGGIRAALRAAGITARQAYAWKRADPGFATVWQEARAAGYARLEQALLGLLLDGSLQIVTQTPEGEVTVGRSYDLSVPARMLGAYRAALPGLRLATTEPSVAKKRTARVADTDPQEPCPQGDATTLRPREPLCPPTNLP